MNRQKASAETDTLDINGQSTSHTSESPAADETLPLQRSLTSLKACIEAAQKESGRQAKELREKVPQLMANKEEVTIFFSVLFQGFIPKA